MRWVGTDGCHFGGLARTFAGAAVFWVLGCRAEFTGPYPCEPHRASCIDPSQNACETNTATDGLNCGACGKKCGVGAPCVSSQCGPSGTQLAALAAGSPPVLKTNSTAVFWSASNGIFMLPASAGPGTIPTLFVGDAYTCGNAGPPFAVDEANVYYWANGSGCTGTGACGGLTQISLADGTRTVLVSPPTSGLNTCGTLAVGATSVYVVLASQQQGNVATYTVYSALIGVAGQTLNARGSVLSYNGASTSPSLAINSTDLFFEVGAANNGWSFQVLPIDGGPMTSLPGVGDYGSPFVADDANIYTAGSSCFCNNNNGSNNNGSNGLPPTGSVIKLPLDGGPSRTLATPSGEIGGIAVDSTDVYWSTDTTARKVPIAGGASTSVAGNLTNGGAPFLCVTCGGSQSPPTAIAVGASGVYIAVTGTNESAILEVAK